MEEHLERTVATDPEVLSDQWRERLKSAEPKSLRTFTPTLAVIHRSAGCYHWTSDDRRLIDFSSGVLVANLGHNPVRWWQRVMAYMQLDGVADASAPFMQAVPLSAYNAATELEVVASERLLANLQSQPGGNRMELVMWAASGSEAIQKALWAALRYRQDGIVLATRRGFHGKKGLAGAITGSEQDDDRDQRVRFLSFPTDECLDVDTRRRQLDLSRYQAELEQLQQEFGDRICCIATEPYLGGGGSFHPQPEYLQLLQKFCRDNDALLLLDEIQSNFGRTGTMYAFTHYGIEPDIVCLGKGLGNGVPVSAAVGRRDIFSLLNYGEASDTWSANPLSSAAVLATLDSFEEDDVLHNATALAEVIERGLVRLKETGIIRYVRGEGTVWGIQCQDVGQHSAADVANACVRKCYEGDAEGHAIHLLGPLASTVIRISPPLVMSVAVAQQYLDAMYEMLSQLYAELAGS